MYPGKPITKKLTKMSTGKPITNFLGVNQLGLTVFIFESLPQAIVFHCDLLAI